MKLTGDFENVSYNQKVRQIYDVQRDIYARNVLGAYDDFVISKD